jgi:predicted RNA-binding protein YlqC (UPF0109 family)
MPTASEKIADLLYAICKDICDVPEEVMVIVHSMATATLSMSVECNQHDKRHLVGKNGMTAQAIRTVIHSVSTKWQYKTYLNF